jgi:hypothetical protein
MAAIGPQKILKLWNKINDRFGPKEEDDKKKGEKQKVSEKEKLVLKQNEKIEKGLTVLRNVAQAGVKAPSEIKRFDRVRTKALRVLTIHCKTIRGSKMDVLQDTNKYRTNVRQLTVLLGALTPQQASEQDEGEPELSELLGVDDAQLDEVLDDPALVETDSDSINFDDEDGTPGESPQPTGTVRKAPPLRTDGEPAKFNTRAKELMARLVALQKTDPVAAADLTGQVRQAQGLSQKKDYAKAHDALGAIEARLAKLGDEDKEKPDDEQARLKARLTAVLPVINEAKKGPRGSEVKVLNSELNLFLGKKEYAAAHEALDRMEALLKGAPTEGDGKTPPEPPKGKSDKVIFIQARLDWMKARSTVLNKLNTFAQELRTKSPDEADVADALGGALDDLDDRLATQLDKLAKTPDEKLPAEKGRARLILKQYLVFLAMPIVKHLDRSPYPNLAIQASLTPTLTALAGKLS